MPFNSQKIPINGKLNKDTDLSKVPQGDRLDALNTSFLVDEHNTENSVKIVKGNELAYTIPAVTAQNKTIRIYFEAAPIATTSIYSMTIVAGIATVQVIGPLDFNTGDTIFISGVTGFANNPSGYYVVTSFAPFNFTIVVTPTTGTYNSGSGTASSLNPLLINNITIASNAATIRTYNVHYLTSGTIIFLSGVAGFVNNPSGYYEITATGPTTFTIVVAPTTGTYIGGSGTISFQGSISFINNNGGVLTTASYTYGFTANATMLNALGSCTAALSLTGIPASYSQGADYIDLMLLPTGIVGAEWLIEVKNTSSPDFVNYITLEEAIPFELAGEQNIIGKNAQPGVRFDWSTTQTKFPQLIPFSTYGNITYSLGVVSFVYFCVRLITSNPHNLQTGQVIQITNAPVGTNANGVWSVDVIDAFTFDLVFSVFGVFGSGSGDITINVQGYGQIGAVQYDVNTDIWTYTRLIGSKDFNFIRSKQIDNHVEYAGGRYSMYFTDDYNPVKCFYYDGPFVTDGAIGVTTTGTNPLGIYQYGSIGAEISLLLSGTNIKLNFIAQLESGGQIPSGNSSYTVCFLTESLVRTDYLDLSNPISAFNALTTGAANLIIGDDPNTLVGKSNQFEVTGILPGLFKYVELVRVNYIGSFATSIKTVSRELLNGNSITLYDRGDNAGTTDLSAGELLRVTAGYVTAKNIRAIDNRLILSNLTTSSEKDLTAWCQTFTHSLYKLETHSSGSEIIPNDLSVNEYAKPENVHNITGYMDNETYRFGCKVKFKNGAQSNSFWIDDVVFNADSSNNNVPGQINPDNRRLSGLPHLNLTNANGDITYYTGISFSNINFDYLVNGVRVRDLIDELIFERVQLDAQTTEILACGVVTVGYIGSGGKLQATHSGVNINLYYKTFTNYGEFPFTGGDFGSKSFFRTPNSTTYTSLLPSGSNQISQPSPGDTMAAFYSPDIFLGKKSIGYSTNDSFINHGCPQRIADQGANSGVDQYDSFFSEYFGFFNNPFPFYMPLTDNVFVPKGGQAVIGGLTFSKYLVIGSTLGTVRYVPESPVLMSSSPFQPLNGNTDYGLRYGQYYRNLGGANKFGKKSISKYVTVGSSISVSSFTTNVGISNPHFVFGGDTFVQKTYFKNRYFLQAGDGYGSGIAFYSQNKINSQMKGKDSGGGLPFPVIPAVTWLTNLTQEVLSYNHAYDIQNAINIDSAFDPNAKQITDLPTRVAWSVVKPIGSLIDFYRYFYPLQFHDLDATQGEITNHENFNGELVTWQLRALQRQFFNSRGQLQTSTTSLVIGDGSVMQRDGVRVTGYGSQHKWSVLKGKSKSGDDYYAWINAETKSVQALGMNGTDVISESKDMNSWFNKNITWASLYDTPADGKGICGVWYENNNQFYWTFMGHRKVADWVQPITGGYSIGDVVSYSNGTYSTFNETPDFYRSTRNNNSKTPSISSNTFWELIPHTDRNYYNEYTLAFTNYKQVYSFTEFFSFKPKIYLEWGNTFMTPRPVNDTGSVYLHWEGDYGVWYDNTITKQEEEGYIQLIFNTDTDLIKHFLAVLISSEVAPYKIDFVTKNHTSTLLAVDFDAQIDQFQAGIKEDQTNPSNLDASALWGQYVKIKIYFEPYVYQKLNSFVLKYFAQPRTYNK